MKRLIAAAGAAALFALSALPAFSASGGSVAVRISVASPCVTVGPDAGVAFAATGFSNEPRDPVRATGDRPVVVASCATAAESLFVHGTGAGGSHSSWTLVAPSAIGQNAFGLELRELGPASLAPLGDFEAVSTADRPVAAGLGESGQRAFGSRITMPVRGSDGAGETMSSQIVFTVAF